MWRRDRQDKNAGGALTTHIVLPSCNQSYLKDGSQSPARWLANIFREERIKRAALICSKLFLLTRIFH